MKKEPLKLTIKKEKDFFQELNEKLSSSDEFQPEITNSKKNHDLKRTKVSSKKPYLKLFVLHLPWLL